MEETFNISRKNIIKEVAISIVPPFKEPPEGSELVIFANNRPYVPFYDVRKMLSMCASYAVQHKVYLVPERFAIEDCLCLSVIGPDGAPVGLQRSCHLPLSDRGTFRRDVRIDPVDTPFGKIALLPSVDMNIPYVRSEAAMKGAELFIGSLYMESYDFSPQRASLYAMNIAQSTSIPVAAAVGNGGIIVNGDWSIAAPFRVNGQVFARVNPSDYLVDQKALKTGNRLLNKYKKIFMNEKKVDE